MKSQRRGDASGAGNCCLKAHVRHSGSVPRNVEMTGGTVIRISSRELDISPMSVKSVERGSRHIKRLNTVPEHVFTHRGDL